MISSGISFTLRLIVVVGCLMIISSGISASKLDEELYQEIRSVIMKYVEEADDLELDNRNIQPDADSISRVEYRIPLPLSLDEYKRGQLYTVAEFSLAETGGGEGVEIIKNERFEENNPDNMYLAAGQFTHKIFHLASKVPRVIRMLAPKGSLEIHEESWNSFPYVKTNISNPDYMKDEFHLTFETMHRVGKCDEDNVLDLPPRQVVYIDITGDPVASNDYKEEYDPLKCSSKTGRSPLSADWMSNTKPEDMMCAYKYVETEFKWWGLQTTMQSRIIKAVTRLLRNFNRQLFCELDNFIDLSMEEIREMEILTKLALDQTRNRGEAKGTFEQ